MKYTVTTEFLPAMEYLVIKGYVELGGSTPDAYIAQEQIFAERINDGSIECLQRASGSEKVYTIFCHTCVFDEKTGGYICGHDIACENRSGAQAGGAFDVLRLEPSEYAVFDCYVDGELSVSQASKRIDDIYWGEWLENNPYESMIETTTGANTPGIACIGMIEPLDPAAEKFHMKTWFPIRPK